METSQNKLEQPKITVGIPTFNRPDLLRGALRRVTNQTYRNLEILVSDNCSDCGQDVQKVVEEFSKEDSRVRFFRQPHNRGAILNLKFLLDTATSDYFMWAADDDDLEPIYIEELYKSLVGTPGAVLAFSGYDLLDEMTDPPIEVSFTNYLQKLPSKNLFKRYFNYLAQPEYYGKIRILWGLADRKVLLKAFDDSLDALPKNTSPQWHLMPIELRVLAHGNLTVVNKNLFHAKLLPTSDGKKEGSDYVIVMIKMCRDSFEAYRRCVDELKVSPLQKKILRVVLAYHEYHSLLRVIPYYTIQRNFPNLARTVKSQWFRFFVRG